jgi:hypothetical protein
MDRFLTKAIQHMLFYFREENQLHSHVQQRPRLQPFPTNKSPTRGVSPRSANAEALV